MSSVFSEYCNPLIDYRSAASIRTTRSWMRIRWEGEIKDHEPFETLPSISSQCWMMQKNVQMYPALLCHNRREWSKSKDQKSTPPSSGAVPRGRVVALQRQRHRLLLGRHHGQGIKWDIVSQKQKSITSYVDTGPNALDVLHLQTWFLQKRCFWGKIETHPFHL